MKKIRFLSLFLSVCLLVSLAAALPVSAAEPALSSYAAILVDRATGGILYTKNADRSMFPASLTKLMTVLLAVEDIEGGAVGGSDPVTVQASAFSNLGESPSTSGLRVGDTLTLEELLYCALLASGNEACCAIAEHLADSPATYAARMTERAAALGCADTRFSNVYGDTDWLHKTTALDLARIALAASRHPLFMEICGTAEKTIVTAEGRELRLNNTNALLSEGSQYGKGWLYEGASGMKTGYTAAAGYCLAATAERDGRELLVITLHAPGSNERFRDAAALLDYGFSSLGASAAPALSLLSGTDSGDGFGPSLGSYAAAILDQRTGEVLFSKRADSRVYPADTAKVMTALLAVEAVEQGDLSLQMEVTVSEAAVSGLGLDATRLLSAGETLTLENLLNCTLVASADDAANAVAECLAGDLAAFAAMMNDRAARLGCAGTHFSNPSGLHAEDNYTTAADMARIALEAARHDLLRRICAATSVELPETNLSTARTLKSTNALLVRDGVYGNGYLYEKASGIKTGYNAAAGYCLLSAAADEDSDIQLVAAVYGGERLESGYTSFLDTVTLFDWVFANYSYQEVLSPNKNIASVDVKLGMDTDYVNLRPAAAVTLLLPNNYDPKTFDLKMTVYSLQQGKIVTAPVTAGEVLGEVSVMRDGVNCGTVKLVAAANVDLSRSSYITSHLRDTVHTSTFRLILAILAVILVLYLAWVIYYRVRRLKYKKALRQARSAQPKPKKRTSPAKEQPQAPKIEFFAEGQAQTPAPASPPAAPPSAEEELDALLSELPTMLEDTPLPPADPAEELIPSFMDLPLEPVSTPAAPAEGRPVPGFEALDPILDEPTTPVSPEPIQPKEDPFELFQTKAERDYFEEFFKKKK